MRVKVKVDHSCPTPFYPMDVSPWNSPDQNTGVDSCSLLQGIFPTQGSNPGLPHCRWMFYQLSQWSPMRCTFGRNPAFFRAKDEVHAFVVTKALLPTLSVRGLGASEVELGGLGSIFSLSSERQSQHCVGLKATVPGSCPVPPTKFLRAFAVLHWATPVSH